MDQKKCSERIILSNNYLFFMTSDIRYWDFRIRTSRDPARYVPIPQEIGMLGTACPGW